MNPQRLLEDGYGVVRGDISLGELVKSLEILGISINDVYIGATNVGTIVYLPDDTREKYGSS